MGKKHDENRDCMLLQRIGVRVDSHQKVLTVYDKDSLGIHAWGKIDFLCHYCGYWLTFNGAGSKQKVVNNDEVKEKSRERKAHALTNKNSRKRKD